jgi:leader peptidase (prepilin peptidase) / N-methyltransferase
MDFARLLEHGWLILLLSAWVALCVGSFLNVVIHRLPLMLMREWRRQAHEVLEPEHASTTASAPASNGDTAPFNLMVPRSRCPHCETPIAAWQNIPLVSWILLRGKCRACGAHISLRYPGVELLTAALSLIVLAAFSFTWLALAALAFTWTLIALTFIDYDTKLLPDNLTLPLLWLGLLVNTSGAIAGLDDAVIGAVVGYLMLWSLFWAFKLLTGKEGMGYGDFKLLGALGAWLGWQALPGIILVASVAGLIIGGGSQIVRRNRDPIPFGPFLAIAGWIALIWHDAVVRIALG